MPTVWASASDTATLEAAKPKPRTVTAPNPARASAFRREIASVLAISLMSSTSKSATNVTEPDQPRAGVCEPADGEAPGTALPPDERITNALGNDLIERDIQVKDCEQRNKGSPPQVAGYFGRGPTSGSCGASGTPRTYAASGGQPRSRRRRSTRRLSAPWSRQRGCGGLSPSNAMNSASSAVAPSSKPRRPRSNSIGGRSARSNLSGSRSQQFDPSGPSVADSGQKRTVAGPDNLNPDANQNERGKA